MFLDFFFFLRKNHLSVSLREYLTLLEALNKGIAEYSVEDFYFLSRVVYVKHEQNLDRFDRLFAEFFKDLELIPVQQILANLPEDWLVRALSEDVRALENAPLENAHSLDELLERFKKILEEQKERHEGGNKWVGTGGTSPFGNGGQNPAGIRIGGKGGNRTAAKVWDKRDFKNYDDDIELNTRTMKMALRRLRILTREGVENELALDQTIDATCKNAGLLDVKMQASKQNKVKVLLLLDVGGSMDDHIEECSQLFSAAKHQFKNLEFLYFHNCVYDYLWKDNKRRGDDRVSTWDVLNKYNKDYKVIFVGDGSMASWEITSPRGSVEYYNEEAGLDWLERFKTKFPNLVWLNPVNNGYWQYTHSIQILREWSENRMFPLSISGIGKAMKCLKNSKLRFND